MCALDHHMESLPQDHANARLLAEKLSECPHVDLDLTTVQTNIIVFHLSRAARMRPSSSRRRKNGASWQSPSARASSASSRIST